VASFSLGGEVVIGIDESPKYALRPFQFTMYSTILLNLHLRILEKMSSMSGFPIDQEPSGRLVFKVRKFKDS